MGSSTDAHCYNCGYDVYLSIGGGMFSYLEKTDWPIHCFECKTITSTNIRISPLTCTNCKSTNVKEVQDKELYAGDGNYSAITCWERQLTDGNYKCPKCNKFTLRYGTDYIGRGPPIRWD